MNKIYNSDDSQNILSVDGYFNLYPMVKLRARKFRKDFLNTKKAPTTNLIEDALIQAIDAKRVRK